MRALYKDLIANYNNSVKIKNDRQVWAHYFIYRKISFIMSLPFITWGFSANQVTVLNLFVCWTSFYLFLNQHPVAGALVFLFYYIFDFVDGNIARYTKKSSALGKILDGYFDYLSKFIYIVLFWILEDHDLMLNLFGANKFFIFWCSLLLFAIYVSLEVLKFRIMSFRNQSVSSLSIGKNEDHKFGESASLMVALIRSIKSFLVNIGEFFPIVLILVCVLNIRFLGLLSSVSLMLLILLNLIECLAHIRALIKQND